MLFLDKPTQLICEYFKKGFFLQSNELFGEIPKTGISVITHENIDRSFSSFILLKTEKPVKRLRSVIVKYKHLGTINEKRILLYLKSKCQFEIFGLRIPCFDSQNSL